MEALIKLAPDFANAHSCNHCTKFIVPINAMYSGKAYEKPAAIFNNITDLYDLFVDGCLLLYSLFIRSIGESSILSKVDIAAIGGSRENFNAKWDQGKPAAKIEITKGSYVEQLVIKLEWTYGSELPSYLILKNVEICYRVHALGNFIISPVFF
jgi:hypothetical protein